MIRYSEFKQLNENLEIKRNYNDILKKMGVMNQFGQVDLVNMTKKINDFLSTDDNKDKFLKDVDNQDIKGEKIKISVKDLKPGQSTVYLDQMIEKLLDDSEFTKNAIDGKIKDRDILISSDNYIIDGHHRCCSAFSMNPECVIKCTKINIPIEKAIPILNSILKATESDSKPESGDEKSNVYDLMKKDDFSDNVFEMIHDIAKEKWKRKKRNKKLYKFFDKILPEKLADNIKKLPIPDDNLVDRSNMPQLKDKVDDVLD